MYEIKCDNETFYDPRVENLAVLEPKCKLEVNTVGEASFDILPSHPFYSQLKPLKTIFEIRQDSSVLFRGRMTNNSRELYNRLSIDVEGILAVTNGSYVPPFKFPDDFTIPAGKNVVEVLLAWFIQQHNSQVQPWQQLKIGSVTVTDPNNVIARSSEKFLSTWECLKTKLFGSSLGGKMYVRYESDGNYLDYVSAYPLTNVQHITLGENILDLKKKQNAQETYSAILPIGSEGMTLAALPDGDLSPDFVKAGNFIYSREAVAAYGWICAPISDTTWDDVTEVINLRRKAIDSLADMVQLNNEVTVTALDLNFTDTQVQSLRAFRNVVVDSPAHELKTEVFPLDKLEIYLLNPQDTKITVGKTQKTLTESINQKYGDSVEKSEKAAELAEGVKKQVDNLGKNTVASVAVEYYLSTSEERPKGGEWQTTAPQWVEGRYTWSRTKTVDGNGKTTYSPSESGVCIASGKSQKGADGRGIQSITPEYYLSSSRTTQEGGEWVTTPPVWEEGKYIWTRSAIVYTNPTETVYTTPVVDTAWEALRADLSQIRQEVVNMETSIVSTAQSIILSAMSDYVKTGDYSSFKQTMEAQLEILAGEITMNFTAVTEDVQRIDGDVQNRFTTLSKYIKYAGETAITIGSGDSAIVLELDNTQGISFKKNGVTFGWWDGVDFHTGNIVVEVNERAQFGDFAWVPRSDRSLMFLKVAGVTEEPPELEILQEPASVAVDEGSRFQFTVEAVGDGVQYQWQTNNGGTSWANLPGETNKTFSGLAAANMDGWKYRCMLSDDSGDSMESTEAVLSVRVAFTYSVDNVSSTGYGFRLNADGYYESTNQGVSSSFAICRISFNAKTVTNIRIYFIHSGESTYDFGTIGAVDQALARGTSTDSDVLFIGNAANKHSLSEQSVDATIPKSSDGQHYIEVKYVKDGSVDNAPDSIAFRIEVL